MKRVLDKCFVVLRLGALLCAVGCALLGCMAEPDGEAGIEEFDSVEQSLTVTWQWACADPGQTIWYASARQQFREVGGHVVGRACRNPPGCITHYHICDGNGCGREVIVPWPGNNVCLND